MDSLLELFPLLAFFVSYQWYGLMTATAVLMATTCLMVFIIYLKKRKIPKMLVISAILLAVFGSWTLLAEDDFFIKIKPTVLNCLFAALLLFGTLPKQTPILKYAFKEVITMSDHHWKQLSIRWALLFLLLAGLNEYIWRNYDTDLWVNFKVFGMLPITVIFTLCQIPFFNKHAEIRATKTK